MSTSEESTRLHVLDLCRPGVPLEFAEWRSLYDKEWKASLANPENENEWLVLTWNDYNQRRVHQLWP
ncbi:hypothetical protein [Halorubellus litoreus]|uniref:Uncharacterized protein n=1 Tax=Halorubellus litoreus TaxID=755308 RepID=A0ABD5VHU5_9EURY